MRYVLGIDGGGSKIVCLAANEMGNILGCGRGGPVNTNYVLYQEAKNSAICAINAALDDAGLRGDQVDTLVFSGPLDPSTLNEVVKACDIQKPIRASEGETSRWAARFWINQHIGVTVDAGTGSLSRGWSKDGRESGAGGFGATLGDEGSGVWISMKAIRAVLQAYDGRLEDTRLTKPILEHLSLPDVQGLPFRVSGGFVTTAKLIEIKESRERVRFTIDSGHILEQKTFSKNQERALEGQASQGGLFFRQFQNVEPLTRHEVASLCPVVVEVARQGDQVALQILKEAGIELGRLAIAVIKRLCMENEEFAIVPFGGVFKAGEFILNPFRETCTTIAPNATIAHSEFEPEVGAVLIALNEMGVVIDDTIIRAIEKSWREIPHCRE